MRGKLLIIFFLLFNFYSVNLESRENEDCYLYSLSDGYYDLFYELLNHGYSINDALFAIANPQEENLNLISKVLSEYGISDSRNSDQLNNCPAQIEGFKYSENDIIFLINSAIDMNFHFGC